MMDNTYNIFFNFLIVADKYMPRYDHSIAKINQNINEKSMEFPYRNRLYTDQDRLETFRQLKEKTLRIYRTDYYKKKPLYGNIKLHNVYYLLNGKFTYLIYDVNDYQLYMLSDMFNDECRVHCTFGKHISPYQYYQKNKEFINRKLVDKKIEITPLNIREEIYLNHQECSTHNPLIIRHFIEKMGAKNILDMSSGWGDRLIGALLADVDYYLGIDPNACLHPNYQKIIELFQPLTQNKGKYQMILDGFQNVDLDKIAPKIQFDLVYTSPPYFDYEIYTKDGAQSISLSNNEDTWLEKFIYPSMNKCLSKLRNNGYLVLYFSQEKGKTYMEKWFQWMKRLSGVYYIGNIFYGDANLRHLHPIFIYQKCSIIPIGLYNPVLVVQELKVNDIKINVVRDDLVIGGTKSRAALSYVEYLLSQCPNTNELVYFGASNGYAQVAFAYALQLLKSNLKLTIFFQNIQSQDATKLKYLASNLYANLHYINVNKSFKETWIDIDQYLLEHARAYLIPFGLKDNFYSQFLFKALQNEIDPYVSKIARLWMVIGSGVLFGVLYQLLPKTFFNLVVVGKDVDVEKYDPNRIKLYRSTYKLYQPIDTKIPYPTTHSYDGKIWEFQSEFQNGDYIWNVAGIHSKL